MEASKEIVIQTVQLSTISDILAIILSVVAFFVTVIGFFASLKFYRDGVELQNSANSALSKLEEKTQNIQDQIFGLFDKTLDAAISRGSEVGRSFDELDDKVDSVKKTIIDEALKELGNAGARERERLESVVNEQLGKVEKSIEVTRDIAESVITNSKSYKNNYPESKIDIINAFREPHESLSLNEIRIRTGLPLSIISSLVKRMLKDGYIVRNEVSGQIKYRLELNKL
ncbi:hypothetical protein [Shewanella chilikensis]|uniref:hypothetical protein n=1 Tax=Shewanella chilikensis TaxID=558541 RepID=UPI003A980F45